jgi:hypothetical protein
VKIKEKRPWPIKSETYPGMRISKKADGYGLCAFCSQKIKQGEITYLIYPKNGMGVRFHMGCLDSMHGELTLLRQNNVKKIIAEQLCPNIKPGDELEDD